MVKVSKEDLKKKIFSNFVKLIESRPELRTNPSIRSAFHEMKNKINEK